MVATLPSELRRQLFEPIMTKIEVEHLRQAGKERKGNVGQLIVAQIQHYVEEKRHRMRSVRV